MSERDVVDRERVENLYDEGFTDTEIAEEIGCSEQTVSSIRRTELEAKPNLNKDKWRNELMLDVERVVKDVGFSEVERIKVIDEVNELLTELVPSNHNSKYAVNQSKEGLPEALVYVACKELSNPVSLKYITDVVNTSISRVTSRSKSIANDVGLGLEPISPMQLIPRQLNRLRQQGIDVSEKVENKILDTCRRGKDCKELRNKSASGVAAASIYSVCDLTGVDVSQKCIAEAAGVTDATVRSLSRDLRDLN